jgi:hypothetical protein
MVGEQLDFARGPAARRGGQTDAPPLAFGDDFLDRAAEATGEDGIGLFAEQLCFG